MRRSTSILLIAVMMFGLVSVFAGCGGKSADYATGKGAENIKKDDEVIQKITTRDSESKFMISFTGELVK